MDATVEEVIDQSMKYANSKEGLLYDSVYLYQRDLVSLVYAEYSNAPRWCKQEEWLPQGDSLFHFINESKLFGLFPEDYHFNQLQTIRKRIAGDTLNRKDAALWARADILLTDALTKMIRHIKLGRLANDSITLRKDSVLTNEYMLEKLRAIISGNPMKGVISSLEPSHPGYRALKAGIRAFLDSASFNTATVITFPDKDTLRLKRSFVRRLYETKYIDSLTIIPDSADITGLLKQFQKDNGLTIDGKIGAQTVRLLNTTDQDRFNRIAITLDRFKMLPEQLPEKYIWVNIPSYQLKLFDKEVVKITSRIVVGKPHTRTPVLNSTVYEMITYPQWTIPQSIIVKEILPGLKKDPGYLERKGYSLVKDTGVVDPYTVDWSQYTKGIPYRVVQGSGDDNALGIMKFNFGNKYAVYLHDTNQRYYFSRVSRALSHGCVRVQEWEKMTYYILRNDSIQAKLRKNNLYTPTDSVRKWLVMKEKRSVPVRNRIPVFIRYFTCEGHDGKIVFYEDIYNEDKKLVAQIRK